MYQSFGYTTRLFDYESVCVQVSLGATSLDSAQASTIRMCLQLVWTVTCRYHFVPPEFQYFQSSYTLNNIIYIFNQSSGMFSMQTLPCTIRNVYIHPLTHCTITQVQTAPLNYLYRQGDWVQNDLYQFHFVQLEFQFYDLLL